MTIRIGVIGAENTHAAAIAKTINIERRIPGVSVEYIWGETEEFAQKTASQGQIPYIVKDPAEMMGKIDALIVDHRHAKYHLKAAWPFVKNGIPAFIDKPFCYRASEGRRFLRMVSEVGAKVTSYSTMPYHKSFRRFLKKKERLGEILTGALWGPCDLESQYGGVFFYGVHQVEMALRAFGYNVEWVLGTRNGNGATGQLAYPSGIIVTLNFIAKGCPGFSIAAVGTQGTLHSEIKSDKNPYLTGIRMFTRMFKSGEQPLTPAEILRPVEVLEALERSFRTGKTVRLEPWNPEASPPAQ
ncbi:MAG: Gfo/Idh/MocA family oxidoreductase [Kiritimatiellae bacterium]|nr:Gfo/Idh/MocA family oxidoreductase [Kiritimatiellia bacterium]